MSEITKQALDEIYKRQQDRLKEYAKYQCFLSFGKWPNDWVCFPRKVFQERIAGAEVKGYIWGCATIGFIWMITWWLQR